MIQIYTPKQWFSVFGGCPSLIIKDNGEIYSAEDYNKILEGPPIGKIDYARGHIYGKDYASLMPVPIGYLEKTPNVTKVYDSVPTLSVSPILYIQDDKVYTPEQYTSIFGSNAAGYIKREETTLSGGSVNSNWSPFSETDSNSSLGGFGVSLLKLGGILLAVYCVIGGVIAGVSAALPLWVMIVLTLSLPAWLGYMAFFAKKTEKTKAFKIALIVVGAWYIFCGCLFLKYL